MTSNRAQCGGQQCRVVPRTALLLIIHEQRNYRNSVNLSSSNSHSLVAVTSSLFIRHSIVIHPSLHRHSFASPSSFIRHSIVIYSPRHRHSFITPSSLIRGSVVVHSSLIHLTRVVPCVHLQTLLLCGFLKTRRANSC